MKVSIKNYLPLIYIYLISLILALCYNFYFQIPARNFLVVFLGIFSITFGALKIIRLNDFVEAFSEYDFISQKSRVYGYLFPFFELFFGLSFLLLIDNLLIELFCLTFFTINLFSVILALQKKQKFICACLGDLIKVPLSKVSLIENLTMIFGILFLILT